MEAECPFITFDILLDRLEDLICDVVERVLKSPFGHVVKELNPEFQVPERPFLRMNYTEAIEYLKKNNITKEDGSFYVFGDVGLLLYCDVFGGCLLNYVHIGYTRNARKENDRPDQQAYNALSFSVRD